MKLDRFFCRNNSVSHLKRYQVAKWSKNNLNNIDTFLDPDFGQNC